MNLAEEIGFAIGSLEGERGINEVRSERERERDLSSERDAFVTECVKVLDNLVNRCK